MPARAEVTTMFASHGFEVIASEVVWQETSPSLRAYYERLKLRAISTLESAGRRVRRRRRAPARGRRARDDAAAGHRASRPAGAAPLVQDGRWRRVVAMSVFTEAELRYLTGGQQLGRLATVGADGTPHVVPVGWIYNAARETIDIGGHELERSKKFRDVARTGRAAIVIDDLESIDPWRPRGVEVRGRAEAIALPTPLIRIHPERIVSWGLEHGHSARTVPR
jgi:pyridoxamine 5'-phosphate oxidase family protein